jgi:hypothetical protein
MKRIFKANIAGQVISMFRRKRMDDRIMFDSIMREGEKIHWSPGRELVHRLKEKTGFENESCLFGYLKDKAIDDFGEWQGNLQEVIWQLLRS